METVREEQVNGFEIILSRRDQYNDYSVVYDYRVEVREAGHQHGKSWAVGSGGNAIPALANQAFSLCRSWACRQ